MLDGRFQVKYGLGTQCGGGSNREHIFQLQCSSQKQVVYPSIVYSGQPSDGRVSAAVPSFGNPSVSKSLRDSYMKNNQVLQVIII